MKSGVEYVRTKNCEWSARSKRKCRSLDGGSNSRIKSINQSGEYDPPKGSVCQSKLKLPGLRKTDRPTGSLTSCFRSGPAVAFSDLEQTINVPKTLASWRNLRSVVAPSCPSSFGHFPNVPKLIDAYIVRRNRSSQGNYYLVFLTTHVRTHTI